MKIVSGINSRSVVRVALGALLCWAALSKLANVTEFLGDMLAYRLPLPESSLRFVAIILPWLELICGLMLLANFQTRAALGWCVVLFAAFVIVTGQAWARRLNISCGCLDLSIFGLDSHGPLGKFLESVAFAFFRALLLLGATVWLWRTTEPVAGENVVPSSV